MKQAEPRTRRLIPRLSLQHTKILCTLGPATATQERIEQLITAGADAFRLNFSHSKHETHQKMFDLVRAASQKLGVHLPVIQDLQGPKIRIGTLRSGPVLLRASSKVVLTVEDPPLGDPRIPVSYPNLAKDVQKGNTIFIDDGLFELRVESKTTVDVVCTVINGGLLKEHKGINLPGVDVSEPALTAKDKEDLIFGLKMGVDYVALSFVRSPDDIRDLKQLITKQKKSTPVIAKIEKIEAIYHLEAIIEVADAIMIARGDLGVELPGHEVPVLQKRIIRQCNLMGKPVVTATQMLESMVGNPRPTRAESSDVANAVIDGSDVVMLSAETSVGAYPVEAVVTMNDIIRSAESAIRFNISSRDFLRFDATIDQAEYAAASAACVLSTQVKAQAILCLSYTGNTARVMSRLRPGVPIVAMTQDEELCRRLMLYRGISALTIEHPPTTDQAIVTLKRRAVEAGIVKKGDTVIITTGYPLDEKASTNMVVINTI